MDPITGTALILALIPLYQRARDNTKQASKEEFYQWLIDHKFQDVKDCITSNFELGTEIEKLLRLNQEELISRFDEVDQKLFCIMNSMSEFSGLVKMIAPKAGLSEQEESILQQFVESGESTIINVSTGGNLHAWANRKVEIKVKRQNIIESSLKQLARLDFLDSCIDSKGGTYYQLTEQAYDYVDNLKKSDLSDQAKSILKQYVESGAEFLLTMSHQGHTIPLIDGTAVDIDINDVRFIPDDLSKLEEFGYIKYDGDTKHGKRYKHTRKGAEYVSSLD